jgi:cystine transport system permease protein
MNYTDLFSEYIPHIMMGALITLKFAIASMILGLILGFIIAMMAISSKLSVSCIARSYVSIIRGTPLLVQMFVVYYGLPEIGISIDATGAGILTLTVNASAYLSESMRGAILGISKGQWSAAVSMGLSRYQTLRHVIGPQALRLAVPSLGNTLISLIKDTSLVSVITVTELLRATQEIIATTYQPLILYVIAAFIYWVMSTFLSIIQKHVEKKLALQSR